MPINHYLLYFLSVLVFAGLISAFYLFGKEEITDTYNKVINSITNNQNTAQEAGPPSKETLYESILSAPINWNSQMKKIREEGFTGNPFIAEIGDLDYFTKSLTLNFDFNYGGEFPQIQKVTAKSSCLKENSYVLSQLNLAVIAEKADIFAISEDPYGRSGDTLISYCLDATCSTIGKECVLVRIENDEPLQ